MVTMPGPYTSGDMQVYVSSTLAIFTMILNTFEVYIYTYDLDSNSLVSQVRMKCSYTSWPVVVVETPSLYNDIFYQVLSTGTIDLRD